MSGAGSVSGESGRRCGSPSRSPRCLDGSPSGADEWVDSWPRACYRCLRGPLRKDTARRRLLLAAFSYYCRFKRKRKRRERIDRLPRGCTERRTGPHLAGHALVSVRYFSPYARAVDDLARRRQRAALFIFSSSLPASAFTIEAMMERERHFEAKLGRRFSPAA